MTFRHSICRRRSSRITANIQKHAIWRVFEFIDLLCLVYFFPFLLAFFASSSCFASKRFGDLYGRLDVFLLGLSAIIRVMEIVYINFDVYAPRVGFEPTTNRLTGDCSTAELSRNSSIALLTFVSRTIVQFFPTFSISCPVA